MGENQTPGFGTLIVIVMKGRNLPNLVRIGKQNPFVTVTYGIHKKTTKPVERGGQTPEWDEEFRFEIQEDMEDLMTRSGGEGGEAAVVTASGGIGAVGAKVNKAQRVVSNNTATKGKKVLRLACYADDPKDPKLIGEAMIDIEKILDVGTYEGDSSFRPPSMLFHLTLDGLCADPQCSSLTPKEGDHDAWFPLEKKGRQAGEVYIEFTFYSSVRPPPSPSSSTSATPHLLHEVTNPLLWRVRQKPPPPAPRPSEIPPVGPGHDYGGLGQRVEDDSEDGSGEGSRSSHAGSGRGSRIRRKKSLEIADYPDPDLGPLTHSVSRLSFHSTNSYASPTSPSYDQNYDQQSQPYHRRPPLPQPPQGQGQGQGFDSRRTSFNGSGVGYGGNSGHQQNQASLGGGGQGQGQYGAGGEFLNLAQQQYSQGYGGQNIPATSPSPNSAMYQGPPRAHTPQSQAYSQAPPFAQSNAYANSQAPYSPPPPVGQGQYDPYSPPPQQQQQPYQQPPQSQAPPLPQIQHGGYPSNPLPIPPTHSTPSPYQPLLPPTSTPNPYGQPAYYPSATPLPVPPPQQQAPQWAPPPPTGIPAAPFSPPPPLTTTPFSPPPPTPLSGFHQPKAPPLPPFSPPPPLPPIPPPGFFAPPPPPPQIPPALLQAQQQAYAGTPQLLPVHQPPPQGYAPPGQQQLPQQPYYQNGQVQGQVPVQGQYYQQQQQQGLDPQAPYNPYG